MRNVVLAVLANVFLVSGSYAAALAPCSSGAVGENIIPVRNGLTTYCVSDYGWSDTWLLDSPLAYNANFDMLSGDDAFNLHYTTPPSGQGAGLGWLSPSLDAGTLSATRVPSNYTVLTPVHSTGANAAESVIINPDGLRITIDTVLIGLGVRINLFITNTSISPITGLQLADYFNFHPNGSGLQNSVLGTTSIRDPFQTGGTRRCVVTTGPRIQSFLSDGFVCGTTQPTRFEVGPAVTGGVVPPVWQDVQNVSYLNNFGPLGPGDNAGALEWDLGTLAPGATLSFAVGKNVDPNPEPASALLLGGGLCLLAAYRRAVIIRRRNGNS